MTMPNKCHRRPRLQAAIAVAASAVVVAGCGSAAPGHPGSAATVGAPAPSLPLGTSLGGPGQPGWAVVEMGGSAASHENFWELFARPTGSARWTLATPPGAASNGGLVVAAAGGGLTAGFRPSQFLTFSPLAAIAGPSAAWSQSSALVSPGLASEPDALAVGPAGALLALTTTGEVLLGAHGGTSWTRLATLRSAAATSAGRACGLTAFTAVAFTPAGVPLLAGRCTHAEVGIFLGDRGSITGALVSAHGAVASPTTVIGMTAGAGRTTALVEAGTGQAAGVFAAWQGARAGSWAQSAIVHTGGAQPRSLSIWANGGAGIVLSGGSVLTIAGPGAGWKSDPAAPDTTATLALGPAGQLEALAAGSDSLTVWELAPSGAGWNRLQEIKVTIPYGSSS